MRILKVISIATVLASSLFATTQAKLDVRHDSFFGCKNGFTTYINGKDVVINQKGFIPKFDELEGTAITDAFFFTGDKKMKSVQFFKDGFAYQNKLYRFKKEFSQKFFTALSNNWAFGAICMFQNEKWKPKPEQKDYDAIWSYIELSEDLQKKIEEWVYQVSLFEAIDGFDGSLRTSSYIHHFPSDLLNIESYNQAIDNIKKDTQKTVTIAHKMLQDDIKRTEIAKSRGELAVTNVHLHNLKLYENLKKLGGDNEN